MKKRLFQVFFLGIGIILIVRLTSNIFRLFKGIQQINLAEKRVLQLEKEKEELSLKRQYYQSPEFIEEEARNKLNMAKPGETIVILPSDLEELIIKQKARAEANPQVPHWKKWWKLFF